MNSLYIPKNLETRTRFLAVDRKQARNRIYNDMYILLLEKNRSVSHEDRIYVCRLMIHKIIEDLNKSKKEKP